MDNKRQINKLRDNAELAWASYGYFDCLNGKFKTENNKIVLLENILDITYKNSEIINHKKEKIGKLGGDMTPTQVKNFVNRYKLVEHCPNTDTGFSATLFKDLGEIDENSQERKIVDSDSQYILAIRGTESK